MSKLLTKQLLLSSSYWVLNKDMVKMLGLESAFLLSNFAEAETMMSDENGWFYQTSDTVEKMTTLTRHKQDQCIKDLDKKGILEKDVRGIPPKRYFRINYECLTNQFVKFQQINMSKINKSICKKSTTNKEHTYKEHTYKEHIKADEPSKELKTKDKNLIIKKWNELEEPIPKLRVLKSGTLRYDNLKARLNDFEVDDVIEAIDNINKSEFLKGKNNRGWTIDFGWFVLPNNFIKVLEGNYTDKPKVENDTTPEKKGRAVNYLE